MSLDVELSNLLDNNIETIRNEDGWMVVLRPFDGSCDFTVLRYGISDYDDAIIYKNRVKRWILAATGVNQNA